MARGIPVTDQIVPTSSTDVYPTHEDINGKGGYIALDAGVSRNSLPIPRLKIGMEVREGTTLYMLTSLSPVTWQLVPDGAALQTDVNNRVKSLATVNTLKAVDVTQLPDGSLLRTGCHSVAASSGGLSYRYDASSSATPNDGTIIAPAAGAGRFIATEWTGSVRSFGARGDGVTDDTAAFQAAIDYAQTYCNGQTVIVPAGIYVINSITLCNSSLEGEGSTKINSSAAPSQSKSVLLHKVGATGHMIVLTKGPGQEAVRGLYLRGRREQNQRNPVAIAAVADRTHFSVAVANLPATPASPSGWPFYGLAFFFSAEGRYMGSAVISAINSGTGQCTILGGWDNYATRTGAGQLLTTSERVCFSPVISFTGFFQAYPNISDPTSAGWCAIRNEAGLNKRFQDLFITHWHCAIALGDCLCMEYTDVWTCYCTFAGVASIRLGVGADDHASRLFLQGFYQRDMDLPAETTTFVDEAYRFTLFGMYGVRTSAVFEDITLDQFIHGVFDFSSFGWVFTHCLIDKPLKEAILSVAGSTIGRAVIRNLQIATYYHTTIPSPTGMVFYTGARSALGFIGGLGRSLDIGWLQVSRFGGQALAADDFDRVFYLNTPNAVECRSFAGVNGYANIWGAGGTGQLTIAVGSTVQKYNAANPVAKADFSNGLILYSDVTSFANFAGTTTLLNPTGPISLNPVGDIISKLNGYDAIYCKLNGSDPSVGIRTASPRRFFDVQSGFLEFGADTADLRNRTANTGKTARFIAITYNNVGEWNFISAESTVSANTLHLGGNGVGGCPTTTSFFIASDATGAPATKTEVVRVTLGSTGLASVWLHDGTSLGQIKIGAAGTGPGGSGRALYLA